MAIWPLDFIPPMRNFACSPLRPTLFSGNDRDDRDTAPAPSTWSRQLFQRIYQYLKSLGTNISSGYSAPYLQHLSDRQKIKSATRYPIDAISPYMKFATGLYQYFWYLPPGHITIKTRFSNLPPGYFTIFLLCQPAISPFKSICQRAISKFSNLPPGYIKISDVCQRAISKFSLFINLMSTVWCTILNHHCTWGNSTQPR